MRKFLIGCGVVLGLFLLAGLVGSWVLMSQIKKELPGLERVESQQKELRQRFGRVDEFVAPMDSGVDEQRLALYIAIREALPLDETGFGDAIARVSEQEKRLKQAKGLSKIREGYRIAKQGMGVARVATAALAARDSLLLANEMGSGEYLYYTVLGPIIALDYQPTRCIPESSEYLSAEDAESLEEAPHSLMQTFRQQLANARRELRALPERSEEEEEWLEALDDELEHGRIGKASTPFADGLPLATVERLAPYRDRLLDSLPRCREAWSLELLVASDEDDRGVQVRFNSDDE